MKNSLFPIKRERPQLTYKIFSFKPASIITRLTSILYTLTLILILASCGVNLDSDGVKTAAAGHSHTIALKNDGTLWAWGQNIYGQLGDGTEINRSAPVQVETDRDWIAVAAGSLHTVAIKKGGSLWAWGSNGNGRLGDGTEINRSAPVQVKNADDTPFADVKTVTAGLQHTVAIKIDGTLWAWGYNASGQLGDGTETSRDYPVQVNLEEVTVLFAGGYHTAAIKKDGTLWAWGWNYYGQLGDGTEINRSAPVQVMMNNPALGKDNDWASVSGGYYHTIAHKKNGTLWAWGRNEYGQLGLGDDEAGRNQNSPVQLGEASDLVEVFGGYSHSAALRRSGILWTWGLNNFDQLGNGTPTGINCSIPNAVKWE
ncbi:MAG: hypothetical protein FWG49_04955 [Leptospirales bacterium]|nr:hypothetical protein [Leptospirales bacterium]